MTGDCWPADWGVCGMQGPEGEWGCERLEGDLMPGDVMEERSCTLGAGLSAVESLGEPCSPPALVPVWLP